MAEFRKTLQGLSFIVKLLLVIVYDIYGALYRISSGNTTNLVVGILQLVIPPIGFVFTIIDLITVITKKEVTVLA
jgi:hypothetical protein